MKTIMLSAAFIALGTTAFAQDAFISQVGDDHAAVNYSQLNNSGNTNRDNLQVIAQQSETDGTFGTSGFRAANLASGANNTAYTYQLDLSDFTTNRSNGSTGATMDSLTWQEGNGNNAVAVQLINQAPARKSTHVSQILQAGDNNVGINWSQNNGGGLPGLAGTFTASAPTLTLTPRTYSAPTPIANTVVPRRTTVRIN
jgi:hypothetical protein